MEILNKQHIPGKGHVLVAKAEGDLGNYIGNKVEYEGKWWEIVNAEAFKVLMDPPFRDEDQPVGFIVRLTDPPKSIRDKILTVLSDAVLDFMVYDRKEDEDLPRGAIEAAIEAGEITIEDMVNCFRTELGATPMQPIDYFRDMLTAASITFEEGPADIPLACPADACNGVKINIDDPFNCAVDEDQCGNTLASFVFCAEEGALVSIEKETHDVKKD